MSNHCHFLGNLTRNPELKETVAGKRVVNFVLAVNRPYKRGGEIVKETAYLDMEAWDTGADVISTQFKKGDSILVHCSVKQEDWEDKETGQKRSRLKFRVNSFDFLPKNAKSGFGEGIE